MSLNLDSDEILIQVFEKHSILQDFCVVNQKVVIPISSKEKIFDSIVLTASSDNTKFVLALFSYKLKHTY